MTFLGWMAVVGTLLLLMALSSAFLKRLPITTSAIYLAIGTAMGPTGANWVEVNFISWRVWVEHVTEIAVIVSLFVGGLKLRLPLRDGAWRAAYWLAGPVMVVCIAGVALVSHFLLGLSWPVAFLLGAVLAPTDPVLAGTVTVNDSADRDRVRYGLSGEAGFNDGAAFPFVVFALLWMQYETLGAWTAGWALHRLVWAVPAGLIVGYYLGKGIGRFAIFLRSRYRETEAPNDFLALALIAIAYVTAESVGAWGFLAAFAAGIGFRRAEIKTVKENPAPDENRPSATAETNGPELPAEDLVKNVTEEDLDHPARAAGVVVSEIVSFGDTAERLLEVMLVLLVGVCLGTYWDWRAIPIAIALFFVIRPAAVMLFLIGSPTTRTQRMMMAWFGIRGIGSLYYLSYALTNGLDENISDMASITLSVVALSILLHGITSQPVLDRYERAISKNATDQENG